MRIVTVTALHGSNIHGRFPILEATISIPKVEKSFDAQAYRERLDHALKLTGGRTSTSKITDPKIGDELGARGQIAGGVVWAALQLQSLVYTPVVGGNVEATDESDVVLVAVQFDEEEIGLACLNAAVELCDQVLTGGSPDFAPQLAQLRSTAANVGLGRNTAPLVAAARARGIPVRRLDSESLIQLGQGIKARRIKTAITSETGNIATAVSEDKELTKRLLREIGVPVPEGRLVRDAEDAWAAANELGLPVVVKPRDADYGNGVSLDLKTREQVLAAYAAAREFREEVIVEQHITGVLHRLFVVNCEVVAALRREPATVMGDGRRNVSELVDELNRDPRRVYEFTKLKLNDESLDVLCEQGYVPDAVVPNGKTIRVRRFSHSWAGGTNIDVTDVLHYSVASRAVDAARIIGLDVAGLDIVMEDARRPLEEQRGAVIEVNAGPAMILHLHPMCDRPRPVPEKIMEGLFPPGGEDGRIKVALVSGNRPTTAACRLLARLWNTNGFAVTRATQAGTFLEESLGEKLIRTGDGANLAGANSALLYPFATAAVLETPTESVLREGLAVDRCDLAIVIGSYDATELDPSSMTARALRVIVESVIANGDLILDGDRPELSVLANHCAGKVVYFHRNPVDAVATPGCESAKVRHVYWRGEHFCIREGDRETIACDRAAVSQLLEGCDPNAPEVLAMLAAGTAQDLPGRDS